MGRVFWTHLRVWPRKGVREKLIGMKESVRGGGEGEKT